MKQVDELNEARRIKALNKVFNFDGQVMTLGQYINSKKIVRKSEYTRTHEMHRRNLEYKELATPKKEYTLWYTDNGRELGIDVPKLVYEAFTVQPAPVLVEGEGAAQYTFDVKNEQQLALF